MSIKFALCGQNNQRFRCFTLQNIQYKVYFVVTILLSIELHIICEDVYSLIMAIGERVKKKKNHEEK